MATVYAPIAKDSSINTTESPSRNIADVLAQELSGIANAITGGADKVPKTDVATVEPTNTASRAYSVGELVYVNGNLYKVITAISIGATFTVGTNIQSTNVSDAIEEVNSRVDNFKFTQILEVYHQTTTANTWELAATFTITKPALVRALSMFNNSPSKGIALGQSDNYVLALSLVENTVNNIQSLTILLPAGTYNIFTVHSNPTNDMVNVSGVYFN